MHQRLPQNAKKVFSGEMFDTYQWDQILYDGTSAVFEMLKRVDTAVVIATVGDKILFTKQEQPAKSTFYSLPSGRIDKGEKPEEGARRELLEETGYRADSMIFFSEEQPVSKIDWIVYMFIAREVSKVAEQSLDSGEKIEVMLISFEELLQMAFEVSFSAGNFKLILMEAYYNEEKREELKKHIFG